MKNYNCEEVNVCSYWVSATPLFYVPKIMPTYWCSGRFEYCLIITHNSMAQWCSVLGTPLTAERNWVQNPGWSRSLGFHAVCSGQDSQSGVVSNLITRATIRPLSSNGHASENCWSFIFFCKPEQPIQVLWNWSFRHIRMKDKRTEWMSTSMHIVVKMMVR